MTRLLFAAGALLLAAAPTTAQTFHWNPAATGTQAWNATAGVWGTAAGGPYLVPWASGAGTTAVFSLTTGTAAVTAAPGLTAGTLQFTTGGFTLAGGPLTLGGAATVDVAAGQSVALNGVLAGTAGFTLAGGGTATLGAANTLTGSVAVAAGTLRVGHAAALASNPLSVAAAGTLDLNGFSPTAGRLTGAGTVRSGVAGAVALTVGDAGGGTFSGVVEDGAGVVSLVKAGTGTQVLSGANTFTGGVTVTAGTLQMGSTAALGSATSVAVAAAGTLDLGGNALTAATLTGATGGVLRNSGAAATLTIGAGTVSAAVTGSGVGLAKTGAGAATFGAANTFTGGVRVDAGTLTLGGTNTVTGGVLVTGGTLVLSSSNAINGGGIVVTAGTLRTGNNASLNSSSGGTNTLTLEQAGTLDLAGRSVTVVGLARTGGFHGTVGSSAGGGTLGINTASLTATFDGTLGLAGGTVVLSKSGTGTLTVTTANTFAGGFTANGGTLTLAAAQTVTGGVVTVNASGAVLNVNAAGTFTGSANVSNGTLRPNAAGTTFGGLNLSGGDVDLTGPGGALKFTGTPTLALTGGRVLLTNAAGGANNPDRLADAATVNASATTLRVTNTGTGENFAETTGPVVLTHGAAARYAQAVGVDSVNQVGAGQTAALTLGGLTRPAGGGSVNFTGTGLGLNARNQVLIAGQADQNQAAILGGWATTGAGFGTVADWATYGPNGVTAFTGYTSNPATDAGWTAATHLKYTTLAASTLTDSRTVGSVHLNRSAGTTLDLAGRTLTLDTGGLLASATAAQVVQNGTLTAGGAELLVTVVNGTTTVSAAVADNGAAVGLTKFGGGTLVLSGANTHSGETLVKAGTLRLGAAAALGAPAAGTTVASGATLDLNGQAVGAEAVTLFGTTTASLLNTSATPASLTGPVTLAGPTAATLGGAGDLVLTGGVTGGGLYGFAKTGAGRLTLDTAGGAPLVLTAGGIAVSGGVLRAEQPISTTSGNVSVSAAATLDAAQSLGTTTASVTVSTGGTLLVGGALSTTSGAIALNGAGTVGSLSTSTGNVTVSNTTPGIINTVAGTLTTNTGTVTVNGAAARLNVGGSLTGTGVAAVNVQAGGTLSVGGNLATLGAVTLHQGTLTVAGGTFTTGALTLGNNATSGRLVLGGGSGAVAAGVTELKTSGNGTANQIVAGTTGLVTLTPTLGGGANNTFAGVIGGPAATENNVRLVKAGAGTLTLTGPNTYTGGTEVLGGTLLVNTQTGGQSGTGGGAVAVTAGTLGGNGRVAGAVTVASGAVVAPGTTGATGTLTLGGGATLDMGAVLRFDVAAPGTSDSLALGANTLNLLSGGTKPTLQLAALTGFGPGGSYTLATFDAGSSLQLNGVAVADGAELGRFVQGGGATGAIALDAGGLGLTAGQSLVLNRQGNTLTLGFSPVPEPALGLLAAAVGLAAWRLRRRG